MIKFKYTHTKAEWKIMNLDEIFKALGDQNRLRILNLLLENELCVCEIEKVLGLTQSNVSRHLQVLKNKGIVSCRKTLQWIYYRVSDEFFKEYGELCEFLKPKLSSKDLIEVYSAGTEIAGRINPLAIEVMKEKGIDISSPFPKTIFDIPKEVDNLITMGCGVECPHLPCKHKEDWGLSDPAGKPIEEFRKIRDEIEKKVLDLIERIKKEYY